LFVEGKISDNIAGHFGNHQDAGEPIPPTPMELKAMNRLNVL
jgi:hypothetical protein